MTKVGKRIFSIILCIITVVSSFAFSASAVSAEETVGNLRNDFTKLICVSKYGDTAHFPENSVEGILSAIEKGADMVEVSVKATADGELILLSDDNLSRMCVDADGNAVNKNVSETGLYEVREYFLKNGKGGVSQNATECRIPTLAEALQAVDGKTVLVIENAWEYKDKIYTLLCDGNYLNSCVFTLEAGKRDISSWLSGKSAMPLVFSKFTGTVVWKSRSYIKKTANAGVLGVALGSSNAYSMTFNKNTVAKTQGKTRAVIDMTDPKLCGKRADTQLYWDDVTSRGFSVIITDNIEQLSEYAQRTENARQRLSELSDEVANTDLTLCSTYSATKLKNSLADSREVLVNSVCANTLENQYYELSNALNSLNDRSVNDKNQKTVTKGRIVAAVLVVIGFVIAELLFERYRNKSIKLRKVGRKLYGKVKKK
jgi:glycerophosphoryl diester phosphodiesterase